MSRKRSQRPKSPLPKDVAQRNLRVQARRMPLIPHVPSEASLRVVMSASEGIEEAHDSLAAAVAAAREDGHTWAAIAQTLGTSPQSAHKRFGESS